MTAPIIGIYNDGLIAELYERYQQDPAQVDESWRQYFRFAESLSAQAPAPPASQARIKGRLHSAPRPPWRLQSRRSGWT